MRKYRKGARITTMEEFASAEFVWDARTNKVYHRGFCQSWQFRYVKIGVNNGWFYQAIKEIQNENNKAGNYTT